MPYIHPETTQLPPATCPLSVANEPPIGGGPPAFDATAFRDRPTAALIAEYASGRLRRRRSRRLLNGSFRLGRFRRLALGGRPSWRDLAAGVVVADFKAGGASDPAASLAIGLVTAIADQRAHARRLAL